MSYPESIIFEFGPELTQFKSIVCDINMPTLDLEAVLDQIFTAVSNLSMSGSALHEVAKDMSHSEAMFENADLDYYQRQAIFLAVLNLGAALIQELKRIKGYNQHGKFPYVLRDMINGQTVFLSQNSTFIKPPRHYHPRHRPGNLTLSSDRKWY